MRTERIAYTDGDVELEGHLALPIHDRAKRPAVLVAHAFRGQSDFEREKAEALAAIGYAGFALDLYGRGVLGTTVDESTALMRPFLEDRALLAQRMLAAVDAVRAHPRVDERRIAAIGFCFGGLAVLDLARAGADVRGVVAFHGLLRPHALPKRPITAKVLALHGYDDPMAKPDQLAAFADEMTAAGVDWQALVFGHTKHSFTNVAANDPERGTVYDARADARAWTAMKSFLEEVLA